MVVLAQPAFAQQTIGRTTASEVKVSGAMEVHGGEMLLGNGSAITAGDQPVKILLTRGGNLRLCPTTTVHLAKDRTLEKTDSTALMMALDRGALEANYVTGQYSDVLMTPDFRILLSGPGTASLSVRVNSKGDTCVDNHGESAPYVTVGSLFDGGVYRVQANQRVLFEHGSLRDVVDSEKEICGCPSAPLSVATAGANGGPNVGEPADTAFPLAVSQGLAPAPAKPETTPGEVHASVTVPLTYNGATGKQGDAPDLIAAGGSGAVSPPAPAAVGMQTATTQTSVKKKQSGGILHSVGRFFARIFGQ